MSTTSIWPGRPLAEEPLTEDALTKISLNIPTEYDATIRKICRERNIPRSVYLRSLIEKDLKRYYASKAKENEEGKD